MCIIQDKISPTESIHDAYYGQNGVSKFGNLKSAKLSSSSQSNEEEVYLGDSDKDIDWDEVTDAV
jgi:2-hydroxy-3-keto-5-methylthiopentenyl-1-phosphate phosphatase